MLTPVLHTTPELLQALLAKLPRRPGIYQMQDSAGKIIYIGKAKDIQKRVRSYFKAELTHPKTRALVNRICHIDPIVTHSETEALVLEQNLIKQHRPMYNISLKDDKSYSYIYLSAHPSPQIAIGKRVDKALNIHTFGPYPSGSSAREAYALVQKLFMLRTCSDIEFNSRSRPCLEYQIGRCTAPCTQMVSSDDYQAQCAMAAKFLNGDTAALAQQFTVQMEAAADALNFELAAQLRDKLQMLSRLRANQSAEQQKGEADVWAIAHKFGQTVLYVIHIRGGRMLGGQAYYDQSDLSEQSLAELLGEYLAHYYFQRDHTPPKEIIGSLALDDANALEVLLRNQHGKTITYKHQVREQRAQWLSMASLNVAQALAQKVSSAALQYSRLEALEKTLSISIESIEGFDISHTQGEETKASCVAFDRQGINKKRYQLYNIKQAAAGDDYAAMREVLTRRYSKKTSEELPTLIVIDGGKGQLNIAKEVFALLHPTYSGLLGLSKGEGRKAGLETLHTMADEHFELGSDSPALQLLNLVRDEAHRFARHHHTKARDKKRGQSILERIPNLGPNRRRALLTHFGGLHGLLGASEAEIAAVKSIGPQLAHTLYQVMHG